MDTQFEVILTNRSKLLLVLIGGLLTVVVISIAVLSQAQKYSNDFGKGVYGLTFLVGLGTAFWLSRKVSTEPTRITVGADHLSVLNRKSGREQSISYDNISAHRFQSFRGAEQLRVTQRNGRVLKLATNPNFHRGQDLLGPARALEAARRLHQERKNAAQSQ